MPRPFGTSGEGPQEDGDDFFAFAKTLGMTERQAVRAISRIVDSLIANMDDVLNASPLLDEFAARFKQLVRENLNRINVKF